MSTIDVSLRLKLINMLGAGARGAERDLHKVTGAARRIGSTAFGDQVVRQLRSIGTAARENVASFERMSTVAAGLAAGFAAVKKALGAPARADAEFRDVVIDIAQKAEIGSEKLDAFAAQIKSLAGRLQSSPIATGKGIDVLMGSGLDLDTSTALIAPITKVSRAYRVATEDVSKSVFSMVNNLKIAPAEVEVALGRLSQAAADGRYEMSDFARGLPNMASIFQANNQLGLKGVSRIAAAVETVAGVVGTPGEADAALRDLIEKATSDEVLKDFKKAGVKDLEQKLAKARKNGDDVIPVISEALQQGIKGDPGLISKFFADIQAKNAARALGTKEGLEAYLKLRDKYDRVLTPDKLNSDLALRKEGAGDTFRTFGDRFQAFLTSVGTGVNGYLAPFVGMMGQLLDHVTALTDAFPKLTGAVTIFGAAVAGGLAFKAVTSLLGRMAGGAAAGAGAGAAGTAGIAAGGAAAGGLAARAGFGSLLGRLGTIGLAFMAGKATWDGLNALGDALRPRAWGARSREEGEGRLKDLQERRRELEARIAGIRSRSKVPEMAATLAAPLESELKDVENQIRVLEDALKSLDSLRPKPTIDTSSIDEALGKARALHAALSSSFAGNAAPAGSSTAPKGGPGGGVSQTNTFNVTGTSPGTVARRVVEAQNREIARARAGALHDLGAWA
ncbi:phage tail tape measure protein [Prosthecomicrobium hirschii]|uniref:phage tail tape measure protein n=1 Tax=Prosthecodimorpha hirschii TaxID=665126 RepID=UPI00221F7502|nr:phage tail tape measure protein [Prosthecomicrobium hirschii]MCW1842313.1 phage tail tape measure protein [Prosthecomicrobium hirschii]